jgi:hypothetical protein
MKKLFACFCAYLFLFSDYARPQPDYLVKIDQINPAAIYQIRKTGIEVYAKTPDFWVAGADKKDLEFLAEAGMSLQVLHQEADVGEYYFVWPKPPERIGPYLPKIEAQSQILAAEGNTALVNGIPKRIERLAQMGFQLKKIRKKPLPVESEIHIPAYLQSLSPEYDPVIDCMINRVDQRQLLTWIDDLTGEDTVLIEGVVDSIKTRYSYSDEIFKAADYLRERFEEMGLSVELDPFSLVNPWAFFHDVVCSPGGQKAWSVPQRVS